MGKYNFKEDLANSESSVNKVIELLKQKGCTDIQTNDDGKYDISYLNPKGEKRTAEVKHDLMWSSTGNVAIEYKSRGKASCISTSKADGWFYLLNDLYFCKTGDLRAYLFQHPNFRRTKGGDDYTSDLILLKLDDFLDIFRPT